MATTRVNEIRRKAREEATKDFAADWGVFWEIAGHWIGQYAMALLGFAADFAVAFSMIYASTRSATGAFIGASGICALIQYGYGGATFRITKAVKSGKINEARYARSAAIAGLFGLATLGASLYFSYHFDSVFEVASEPQAKKELKDEDAVNTYYDDKIATLRADYETERNALQTKRTELMRIRNEAGEVLWTSRRSVEAIDKKQMPALRSNYETAVAALETERAQRLSETIATNEKTAAKWESRIMQGSMFTRWFNIAINLVRVFLIIGYAVFLLDVYQDEEQREDRAKAGPKTPEVLAVSYPPRVRHMPVAAIAQARNETPVASVANGVQGEEEEPEQDVDRKEVAALLAKAKSRLRAYQSKLRRGEGNEATNLDGIEKAEAEIERLEKLLA